MFEESADGFISRWREQAAAVTVFSRTEGLPLLEVEAGGAILQMLERTGPYLAPPGSARVIINPTAREVELSDAPEKSLEVTGIGRVRVHGLVTRREDPFLVLDAGAPLVVGVMEPIPQSVIPGAWVWFEAVPPIHAFVLSEARSSLVRNADGEAP